MEIKKNLAILLRLWSNNKLIEEACARALATGAVKILLVIKDEDPNTRLEPKNRLADQIKASGDRIVLMPMIQEWTWSNSLNYGFDEIRRHNLKALANGEPTIDFVFNASTELQFEPEHVDQMIQEMETDAAIGAVGSVLAGHTDGKPVALGRSYIHPRNTCMLVRFRAYLEVGCYSPRCDFLGGQEDIDWLIRLNQAGGKWKQLDLKVPLIIGANHHQPTKELRELEAIKQIQRMYAGLIGEMASVFERMLKTES